MVAASCGSPTAEAPIALGVKPGVTVSHQRTLAGDRARPPWLGRRPLDVVRDRRRGLVGLRSQQRRRRVARPSSKPIPPPVNKPTGWIVGVGTEYALLGGWSVKGEWLYANFGSMRYGDAQPGIVNGCISGCVNADVKMYQYIWRVGMNYRFDASWGKGKAPVVAKY